MEIFRQITANNIALKEYPFWKEIAMEAYLLENEEILKLDKQNFNDVSILDAEIALKKGRQNGDGRIDLLAKYSGEYLAIVEIKKGEINQDSLKQLQEYLTQKQAILEIDPEYWTEITPPKWIGILVGSYISENLREQLSNGYQFEGVPIAGLTIKRFKNNNNEIYVISDTYFKFNYSSKDFSKFIFKGQEYNKARLVNAVMKAYVEDNPKISYKELQNEFPVSIQGSFGVFTTKESAVDIFQRWGHKRHYINPDEEIKLVDATIATCNQWNPYNISLFIEQSKKFGYTINPQ